MTENCPEKESELRHAFLLASSEKIEEESTSSRYEFQPLKTKLPSEASLLPHLVNYFLMNSRHFYHAREINSALDYTNKLVTEIVDNASDLERVANDLQLCKNIRAAATIMLLLHPDRDKKLEDVKQLLVEFYNSEVGFWYIKSVTTCLCLLATKEQPVAQWVINSLLEKAREDYESRGHFQKLLNLWRETSYAPIQKAGVQEKWLSETDT